MNVPFYVPVFDAIPVCDFEVPAPKPACPTTGGGYVYHVAGVAPIEITACNVGAGMITGKLVNRIDVHKSVTPAVAVPGQPVTYTITFSNAMAPLATGVVLTDVLPAGIVVQGIVSSGAMLTDVGVHPGTVWQVEDLALGEGGAITISGVVSPGLSADVTMVNTAEILAATDGTGVPNRSEATLHVVMPRLSFSSAAYAAAETVCSAPVTVTLNVPELTTVTVHYTTTDGTATEGEDYAPVSGTLTFTPGITARVLHVGIVSDTVKEWDETVVLTLADPAGAALGTPSAAVLTILGELQRDTWLPLVLRQSPVAAGYRSRRLDGIPFPVR
jgi:uncharacterized repeat protein (TIGR01451 family)